MLQSALSGLDIALWDLKGIEISVKFVYYLIQSHTSLLARRLNVPIYELLGGRVRDKIKVYAWIGGDRPDDVKSQA